MVINLVAKLDKFVEFSKFSFIFLLKASCFSLFCCIFALILYLK